MVVLINLWYMPLNNRDLNNTKKFENVPYNIQICNLGSSHGLYGFNYEELSKSYTCFNFALNSQTLSYDARILDYYKDHLQEGAIVFVTISYQSLFGIPETEYDDFESKNARYYDFLPKHLIKEYDLKTAFLTKLPSLYAYETLPLTLIGHYSDADTELVGWNGAADEFDLPANTDLALAKHLVVGKLDEHGNRIYNHEEINALYNIIETCESVGAIPILITHPYSLIYVNRIDIDSPEFFDDFYAVIDKVTADTGVAYHNFSKDSRFYNDYTYFRDTDHLNKSGATLFTHILMNEIVYPIWEENSN